ncbi:uncharacterized protein LOC132198029 [Neocloeon triangulifer]|uniref:uncharacterized protein LOC132198029 n=1 Tax=Neocloeon triangulifer TaxID=2078957 RepID=UPI00286F254D|nr:uncharacterized protein LOC132198029 [Neocloeon triangulifer]
MEHTRLVLTLLILPLLVSCRPQDVSREKKNSPFEFSRYIKFKTGEGDTLNVDFSFSVPFLEVPLKRKIGDGKSPLDINLRGMAMAAGLGAVASFLNLIPTPYDNDHSGHLGSGLKISKH